MIYSFKITFKSSRAARVRILIRKMGELDHAYGNGLFRDITQTSHLGVMIEIILHLIRLI